MTRLILLTAAVLFLGTPASAQTLQGHWKLDDASGTTAVDSAGTQSGTLLGGPTWTQGQLSGAVDFDGLNDRIEVASGPFGFSSWGGISVGGWIKHDIGAEGLTNDIVGQWNYPSSPAFVLTHHNNNQYFFEISGVGSVTGGTVSANWTHVLATYDGSEMALYVNGVNVATTTGLSGSIPSSTADVVIGSQDDGSKYFLGRIDDVRIYEGALNTTAVQDLYDSAFDTTAPSVPQNVATTAAGFTSISLAWDTATDAESGVDHYDVFRGGSLVGQASGTTYTDGGLSPATAYTYTVEAVNGQGLSSAASAPHVSSTTSDTVAPSILSTSGDEFSVEIFFDEAVTAVSAEAVGNYSIPSITVNSASLAADNRTVTLDTSAHLEGPSYTVTVNGVEDFYGNTTSGLQDSYTPVFNDASLVGHWKLDETVGVTAIDSTPSMNDGVLVNGATWEDGIHGGAVRLDGANDAVLIDPTSLSMDTWSAFSVFAWVKSDVGPTGSTDDIASVWNYPGGPSWLLTHHRNNQYFFEISGKGSVTGGTVSTNWTHISGTYDGSTMRLYVNGAEVDSLTGLSGSLPLSFADLVIGGQDDGTNGFDGLIDDVRVYDRALTSGEVFGVYGDTVGVIASADPAVGGSPLVVQFTAQDPGSNITSYAWDFGDGGTSSTQSPQYTYVDDGVYVATVVATHASGNSSSDTIDITVSGSAPVIDFWYGQDQEFGGHGLAQFFVNILGNASSTVGLSTLTYSLNGAASVPLTIGPDLRRLGNDGDFNADLLISNLINGANQLVVTATDNIGSSTSETLDFTYDPTNVWELPYSIDWADTTLIYDKVQIVDGLWSSSAAGLRILEPEYDRVVAIGDILWTDYEITVPITIHDYTPGQLNATSVSAGFGMTFRWTGHTDDPVFCPQPMCGWLPSGAGAWYDIGDDGPLYLDNNQDSSIVMDIGDTFIWKLRVETITGVGPLYSLKVWEQGTTEPASWTLQKQRTQADDPNGSIVLNLHHVDATIGNISIVATDGPDVDPPTITNVSAPNDSTVVVQFSEDVNLATAETLSNYVIDQGVVVTGAVLESNESTVTLTTSAHSSGATYTMDVINIEDLAGNVMAQAFPQYTYTAVAPVADYLLNETTGLVAGDATGNGHDGSLVGGTTWLTDGTRGGVASFDGVNDRINIPSAPLGMQTWNELTVSAWVRNDIGAGAGTDDILSWWAWTGYPCTDCSFLLTHHANNQYRFELNGSFVLGGTVGTGWTHVTATYDGSELILYVDGLEVDSTPYSGGIPFSSADLVIGAQADGTNYFDGSIDDVIVFDEALSPEQVLDVYNQ